MRRLFTLYQLIYLLNNQREFSTMQTNKVIPHPASDAKKNRTVYMNAVRAMNKGKGDSVICQWSLEFSLAYINNRMDDYLKLRKEFYALMAAAEPGFYKETSFKMYNTQVTLCDSHMHPLGSMISFGEGVCSPTFETIQQFLGYILAKYW